jgi:hypothetical protein
VGKEGTYSTRAGLSGERYSSVRPYCLILRVATAIMIQEGASGAEGGERKEE